MEENEELKIYNKRSAIEFMLVKKDHMSIAIAEADTNGNIQVSSTFFDISQARLIIEYLLKFIYYNGEHD